MKMIFRSKTEKPQRWVGAVVVIVVLLIVAAAMNFLWRREKERSGGAEKKTAQFVSTSSEPFVRKAKRSVSESSTAHDALQSVPSQVGFVLGAARSSFVATPATSTTINSGNSQRLLSSGAAWVSGGVVSGGASAIAGTAPIAISASSTTSTTDSGEDGSTEPCGTN
jgi:hypothetical protein